MPRPAICDRPATGRPDDHKAFRATSHLTEQFVQGVHSRLPVWDSTHVFYRYPARFSPLFARAAIALFTEPGDTVLDPFMGGGTTVVEAFRCGRRAIGTDISSLAAFVSRVKTTPLSYRSVERIRTWANGLPGKLSLRNQGTPDTEWQEQGYLRNIRTKDTWRIQKTMQLVIQSLVGLPRQRQGDFVRCALLKTGQWALDCRRRVPTVGQFRGQFCLNLDDMLERIAQLRSEVEPLGTRADAGSPIAPVCLHRSAVGLETEGSLACVPAPRLVLTSPPYPGVHVLYHRWQVRGRRETPAPFWIAGCYDGQPASYYTFGDRKQRNMEAYFEGQSAVFSSLAKIADDKTTVVQLVAFSEPDSQLPRYLGVMQDVGFVEETFPALANGRDGRLWRAVPNRKFYAGHRADASSGKEVVLFHRLA